MRVFFLRLKKSAICLPANCTKRAELEELPSLLPNTPNFSANPPSAAVPPKAGRVKKGDGKDVHHPNGVNSKKTKVMSKSKNRGMKEKSRLKGSKRKKR